MLSNAPGDMKEGVMPFLGSGGCPEPGVVDKADLWVGRPGQGYPSPATDHWVTLNRLLSVSAPQFLHL